MTNLAILRNITSVPLHIVCGIIMGYNISLVKFSKYKKNKMFKLSKSLLIPIFVHSLYNLFFSILSFRNINNYISVVIMVLFIMGIYVLGCLYILETVVLNKIFMNNLIYDKDYDYLMTRQEFLMRRSNK
jgi:RsiW-degrading membrane proteinase PrsW (M82 family)